MVYSFKHILVGNLPDDCQLKFLKENDKVMMYSDKKGNITKVIDCFSQDCTKCIGKNISEFETNEE